MSNETVSIEVREDGSRVVQSSFNSVADAADKAGASVDKMTASLNNSSGASSKAATSSDGAASSYNRTAGAAVAQQRAIDQLNTSVTGSIKSMDQWRQVEGQLVAAQQAGIVSMSQYQKLVAQLDSQLPSLNASILKEQAAIQSLTSKYDPLTAKMKALEADEQKLTDLRNKGILTMTQYQRLQAGISGQKSLNNDAIDKTSKSVNDFAFASAGATREYGVLIGELARGNYTRLEGSLLTLANRTGVLSTLFSSTGAALLTLGGAVAFVAVQMYQGIQQAEALNAAFIVTGNTSGVTSAQVTTLATSIAGVGKSSAVTQELLTALVGTGRTTSQTFTDVGTAASNAMKLTGDSVDSTVQSFTRLYDDPVKWADEMDQKFHFLTLDVRDHAQSLQDAGDKYAAAEVVAKAFADNTSDRVKELTNNMGLLEKAVVSVTGYLSYVKQFYADIGKGPTDIQAFTNAKAQYMDWYNTVQSHHIDIYDPKNNDVLAYGTKLWNQMKDARDKVAGTQAAAQDAEQVDQQRQAILQAGKGLDSVNDKTQKTIELQTKLNALRANYKTLYFLDPSDKRLAGVNFDVAGNPSGGSYQSKADELKNQYMGKDKKTKPDDSLLKQTLAESQAFEQLKGTIDPAYAAMQQFEKAQETMSKAVEHGWITQNDADFALAQYQAQLFDVLNPLEAFNQKLDKQITQLQANTKQSTAAGEAETARQDLLKKGVVLSDEEVAGLTAKYEAIEKLTVQQQLQQKIQKDIMNQTKDYSDQLTVLNKLLADKSITQSQAQQYVVKQNPDLFAGTQAAMQVQLKSYQDMYAQIDALRQQDLISEQDATIAKTNIWAQQQSTQLQGYSQFFASVAQMRNIDGKNGSKIGKAAAIAQATINTYTAATGAYASASAIPFVGWVLGPIAAAAAIAAGLANVNAIRSQSPGYMAGGYTGNGGRADVAGVVHGQEYVMDAATTARLGVGNLDALRRGAATVQSAGAQAGAQGGPTQASAPIVVPAPAVNVAVVGVKEAALSALKSQEGSAIVLDILAANPGTITAISGGNP